MLGIQLLRYCPNGFPNLVPPKDLPSEMLADVPFFIQIIENHSAKQWWTNFLDSPLPLLLDIPQGLKSFIFLTKKKFKTISGFLTDLLPFGIKKGEWK